MHTPMKTVSVLLIGWASLTVGFAADEEEWMNAPDGFVWPAHIAEKLEEDVPVPFAKLPEAIRVHLNDQYSPEKPPLEIHVRRADLNGDKVPEWLVERPEWGGSGGAAFEILVLAGKAVKSVGSLQGGVHLSVAAPGEKWLRLEGSSRAGGGHFTRYLLQYRKGRYVTVRNEDHNVLAGKVSVRKIGTDAE